MTMINTANLSSSVSVSGEAVPPQQWMWWLGAYKHITDCYEPLDLHRICRLRTLEPGMPCIDTGRDDVVRMPYASTATPM